MFSTEAMRLTLLTKTCLGGMSDYTWGNWKIVDIAFFAEMVM